MDAPEPTGAWFLIGPTGVGKTALSLELAREFGLEVVCMDSMQVYAGLPVTTAQPTAGETRGIPHHLFAGVDLWTSFDTAGYVRAVRDLLASRPATAAPLLFVGGSGQYYNTLLDGLSRLPPRDEAACARILAEVAASGLQRLHDELAAADPETASRIDPHDERRLVRAVEVLRSTGRTPSWFQAQPREPFVRSRLTLGLRAPRQWMHRRLAERLEGMVAAGMVEELRGLWEESRRRGRRSTSLQVHGYPPLAAHFEGEHDLETALEQTLRDHRRFVKRQENWFRKRPEIRWLDPSLPDLPARARASVLAALASP